jgi:general stress protein 26
MSTDINDRQAVEKRLWAEIDKLHTGMLGIVDGEPQHFQPMTAFSDPDNGRLWFFTRTDTDMARDVAGGRQAMFILQAKDQEMQACIGGELTVRIDRQMLEKFWNPHVAAWYPQGKDDPHLTMLCLACEDARVWISQGGPVKYFWEVAKANTTGKLPDIGGATDVTL